jgi:hypothetical protein
VAGGEYVAKCYLFSQVSDPGITQTLDEYVVAYSHLTSAMQKCLGSVELETAQAILALRKLLRMFTGHLEPVVMADSDFELLARLREVAGAASATAYLP